MRVAFLLAISTPVVASAADWAQWRGPNRDGVSKETGLLKEWPKDGPKLVWQASDLGSGYGAVAVAGNRIYLVADKGKDNEYVSALNAKAGKRIRTIKRGSDGPHSGPQYPA